MISRNAMKITGNKWNRPDKYNRNERQGKIKVHK